MKRYLTHSLVVLGTLSIVLNVCLFLYIFRGFGHGAERLTKEESPVTQQFRIAIIKPATVKCLDQAELGFIETLEREKSAEFVFESFDANGDHTRMRSNVEHVLSGGFDLALTIGASCTMLMKERAEREGINLPIVMCAVSSDAFNKFVNEGDTGITGVIQHEDSAVFAGVLKGLKPDLKRVLIVYGPATSGVEEQAERTANEFAKRGVDTEKLPVYTVGDVSTKLKPMLEQGFDAVVTPPDPIVTICTEIFVKLCDQYGIPYMATDREAVEQGAAIGFWAQMYNVGTSAAGFARKILLEGKRPEDVPFELAENYGRFFINSEKLQTQGLQIDPDLRVVIERGLFLDPEESASAS